VNHIVKLIGRKRAFVLAVLLAVNLAFAAVYFFVVMPASLRANERLVAVSGQITSLQQNIQSVKQELSDYQHNLPEYAKLRDNGFFLPQDRFRLVRDLERIKLESGSSSDFSFVVSEVRTIPNAKATEAGMELIVSQIKLDKVTALLDNDFYNLVTKVLQDFPAHLRLGKFTVKRVVGSVGEEVLRKLIDGESISLISAEVDFDWVTIVPQAEAPVKNTGWEQ
jgi:hypothetical protein